MVTSQVLECPTGTEWGNNGLAKKLKGVGWLNHRIEGPYNCMKKGVGHELPCNTAGEGRSPMKRASCDSCGKRIIDSIFFNALNTNF